MSKHLFCVDSKSNNYLAVDNKENEQKKQKQGRDWIMSDFDGTGPRKGSRMHRMGRKGRKAGYKRGNC